MRARTVVDLIGLLLGIAFVAMAVRGYVKGASGPAATRTNGRLWFWLWLAGCAAVGVSVIGAAAYLLLHPSDEKTRHIIAGAGFVIGGVSLVVRAVVGRFNRRLHEGLAASYFVAGVMWIWIGVLRLP